MGIRRNEGTKFFGWSLTDEPYKPDVETYLRSYGTVSVMVSNNGYGSVIEIKPVEARELAAVLIELAALTESEEAKRNAE